jgi:hypothetical protein
LIFEDAVFSIDCSEALQLSYPKISFRIKHMALGGGALGSYQAA